MIGFYLLCVGLAISYYLVFCSYVLLVEVGYLAVEPDSLGF